MGRIIINLAISDFIYRGEDIGLNNSQYTLVSLIDGIQGVVFGEVISSIVYYSFPY